MKHTKELQSKGVGKMTEAQRELLRVLSVGARDKITDFRAGAKLIALGFATYNPKEDALFITDAGRAALKAGEK